MTGLARCTVANDTLLLGSERNDADESGSWSQEHQEKRVDVRRKGRRGRGDCLVLHCMTLDYLYDTGPSYKVRGRSTRRKAIYREQETVSASGNCLGTFENKPQRGKHHRRSGRLEAIEGKD